MPIYEFYCPDNHTVYSFFARSTRFADKIPACPDEPDYRMERLISRFAVNQGGQSEGTESADSGGTDVAKLEVAMQTMEHEFASLGAAGKPDPRTLGKMMRRLSEMTGEKPGSSMNHLINQIEAGQDPESLEECLVDLEIPEASSCTSSLDRTKTFGGQPATAPASPSPRRDPKLYEFI